jgi:hypothetical protein
MAVLLRDLFQVHVERVLFESAGFLGQRQRREAGPAGDSDRHFGVLRYGRQRSRGDGCGGECDQKRLHECLLG